MSAFCGLECPTLVQHSVHCTNVCRKLQQRGRAQQSCCMTAAHSCTRATRHRWPRARPFAQLPIGLAQKARATQQRSQKDKAARLHEPIEQQCATPRTCRGPASSIRAAPHPGERTSDDLVPAGSMHVRGVAKRGKTLGTSSKSCARETVRQWPYEQKKNHRTRETLSHTADTLN